LSIYHLIPVQVIPKSIHLLIKTKNSNYNSSVINKVN
jgi:hypothetical protein